MLLVVLCLVLLSNLHGSNSRRCCPIGEGVNPDELDGLPQCDDTNQTDTCLDFNKTVVEINCEWENLKVDTSWPHVRLCCPYGYAYSSTQYTCVNMNITDETNNILWKLIPDNHLLVDFDGLSKCLYGYAIVDNPITLKDVIFDNTTATFTIRNRTELTQLDYCFAPHDEDPESTLIIRSCLPREKACTPDRICLRRCCKDGKGFYGDKMKCRRKWQPYPIEIFEIDDDDNFTQIYPMPFEVAMAHKMPCRVYLVEDLFPDIEWKMIADGTVHFGEEVLEYEQFCVENFQLDTNKGMKLLRCGAEKYTPKLYLYRFALVFSSCCLFVTFIIYLIIPRLHNLHGKTLICYVAWYIVCYISFAVMHFRSPENILCIIIGCIAYISFISAGAWMNIMSFDIWWALGDTRSNLSPAQKRQRDNRRFAYYNLYASAVGGTLTGIMIFAQFSPELVPIEYSPGITVAHCFLLNVYYGKVIFFMTPLGIMITANLVFFSLTVRNILKIRSQIEKMEDTSDQNMKKLLKRNMAKFAMNAKLFVVMGAIWIFDIIILKLDRKSWFWYLPNTANSLHGFFIFCIYILKKDIFKDLKGLMTKSSREQATKQTNGIKQNGLQGVHYNARGNAKNGTPAVEIK